jgi:predicted RNase H-like nuclease
MSMRYMINYLGKKMIYIGVDSCPAGWISIIYSQNVKYYKITKTFLEIFNDYNDEVLCLVDIPIGLCDEPRRCDMIARSILGKRSSSVFSTPVYNAVYAKTYEDAKQENFKLTGKYISKQAYNICPKIRDVNDTIPKLETKIIIREMHPEVSFWALNDKKPCDHYKKTPEGKKERLNILSNYSNDAILFFEMVRADTTKKMVADDDIIDALVGAITAKTEKLISFPSQPQLAREGLLSEMVFYDNSL